MPTDNTPTRTSFPNGDEDLIDEYLAQADIADTTRTQYRARLLEFSGWLSHPHSRTSGSASLLDVKRADIARFAAYLTGGTCSITSPTA